MATNLYWGKRPFLNTVQICSAYYPIGKLFYKTFSQGAQGELNGKSYSFNTSGFLKQRAEIIDNLSGKRIGRIIYSGRMNRASLFINGKNLNLNFCNWRNTKWQISDTKNVLINYEGTSTGGQIDSNTDNDLLVLTGIFIKSYYCKMVILCVFLAFIPVWVPTLNK